MPRALTLSDWEKIQPPAPSQVTPYASLPQATDPSVLSKLAVLKLNGGLGTTMGWYVLYCLQQHWPQECH